MLGSLKFDTNALGTQKEVLVPTINELISSAEAEIEEWRKAEVARIEAWGQDKLARIRAKHQANVHEINARAKAKMEQALAEPLAQYREALIRIEGEETLYKSIGQTGDLLRANRLASAKKDLDGTVAWIKSIYRQGFGIE